MSFLDGHPNQSWLTWGNIVVQGSDRRIEQGRRDATSPRGESTWELSELSERRHEATYLRVLIVKVPSQANKAIIKVAVKAFCREQMERVYGQTRILVGLQIKPSGHCSSGDVLHAHFSSVRA